MTSESRIPKLQSLDFDGALLWFAELQAKGLLFHPDEDPEDIIRIRTSEKVFTGSEANELRIVMKTAFDVLGDRVYDACYPVFMHAAGQRLDA
jgi:hypothetical protein